MYVKNVLCVDGRLVTTCDYLLQVIERALTVLKTLPPNMAVLPQQSPMQIDHTVFYRKQAWLVVQVLNGENVICCSGLLSSVFSAINNFY